VADMTDNQNNNQIENLLESNKQLNILSEFAIALLRMSTTEEVIWYVTSEVIGHFGFQDCVIYLWDQEKNCLVQRAAFGHKENEKGTLQNALELQLGQGIVGHSALVRQPLLINDLSSDPNYIFDSIEARSELAVPMIYADELIGVIDSENCELNFYSEFHLKMLTTVASMASSKLAQTKLIDQLETSISELEYAKKLQGVLFNIAALTYDDDSFYKIYQKIHELIAELLYAKSFFIAIYNQTTQRIDFPYYVDESTPDIESGEELSDEKLNGMSAYVIFNNQALMLNKSGILEHSQRGDFQVLGNMPESWLGVPIGGDELKGAIVVQSYTNAITYFEKDKELLSFVSRHISNLLKRKLAEQKLHHLALHDVMTGLANRSLFLDRISHRLKKQERDKHSSCAILYLDVDLFKQVNDRYGHGIGDALLIHFSQVLSRQVRISDTVARLGGDEFAIFIEDLQSHDEPIQLAKRILEILQKPFEINDIIIKCSSSIGIAYLDEMLSASEAIRRADTAMYHAKALGRGIYYLYEPSLDDEKIRDFTLGDDIHIALLEHQFVLHYQPIVSVSTEQCLGFEALLRWPHPIKSWIPPNEFIGYAERHKLISKIDNYVLREAVQQLNQWSQQYQVRPKMSVNISGAYFASKEFIDVVLGLLTEFQIPQGSLGIEITEGAVIENFSIAQANIQLLQAHHVRVLLDDFGTGYSSLNYLHQLSLDVLKIDRTFIKGCRGTRKDNPIINSVVALGSALNLTVVAEGVETLEELSVLKDAGCDQCQGFYFSKALPPDQALAYFLAHA
jgi:diguanylate cyclase (GGDEF)-like protein